MKKILKLLTATFLQTMLIEFIKVVIVKIDQNNSMDNITKERCKEVLHSIDIEDFIKNV